VFVPDKPFQPSLILAGSSHTHKYYTRLERLAIDKPSSVLQTYVNYTYKSFVILGIGLNANFFNVTKRG
jgi:hypothetical protein